MTQIKSFWSVPREWAGETAFLLAGGPSLRGFDAELLRGRGRVIAINNSYTLCPWADVLYGCDRSWWRAHKQGVAETFRGRHCITVAADVPGVRRIRNSGMRGLSSDQNAIRHGSNGGYQAINLAYLFGAARIALLGYDMRTLEAGEKFATCDGRELVADSGMTHFHAGHGRGQTPEKYRQTLQRDFVPHFTTLVEPLRKAWVEVLNCTPGSALTCWPFRPLKDLLESCKSCS